MFRLPPPGGRGLRLQACLRRLGRPEEPVPAAPARPARLASDRRDPGHGDHWPGLLRGLLARWRSRRAGEAQRQDLELLRAARRRMDLLIALAAAFIVFAVLRGREQARRIALLGRLLGPYRIEPMLESLT